MTNEPNEVERVRAAIEASGVTGWYLNEIEGRAGFLGDDGLLMAEFPFSMILRITPEQLALIVQSAREDLGE